MAIFTINPIEDERWLKFITSDRRANIFHHPAWFKVLNLQYKYPVWAICNINENNEITSGLPFCEVTSVTFTKKWISLPFSDYSVPLSCSSQEINEISKHLIDLCSKHKVRSVEIYWDLEPAGDFRVNSSAVYHITEIEKDEQALLNSFHRTKGQGIKKSIKQGLTASLLTNEEALKTFYALHLKTRKKLGVPIQPYKFFRRIYEEIIQKDLGFLVVVSKDGIQMACGLFMAFNDTLTYKYNASDPGYLEYRPNNLIIWEAMKEGIKRGYKYFDFGKSDLENQGLRSFKDGWAGIEKPLYHSYYPNLPSSNGSFNFIKDKFVAPVIKSSPDFVCQFLGEVAYKYFPSI